MSCSVALAQVKVSCRFRVLAGPRRAGQVCFRTHEGSARLKREGVARRAAGESAEDGAVEP